jgi:protein-L-isoaspartate(D-aspartate) O-methyltransferase
MEPAALGSRLAAAIAHHTGIQDPRLLEAFSSVRREAFVGPPPWWVATPATDGASGPACRETSDLARMYDNASIALDARRQLFNGAPGAVAPWLAALGPKPGERAFHVGCATGYYTAVLATLVGPSGPVIGVDVDVPLVERGRAAVAPFPNVSLVVADGRTFDPGEFDVAMISAGVPTIPDRWLDRLSRNHGRLVVPLTVPMLGPSGHSNLSRGIVFLIERAGEDYGATMIGGTVIYSTTGRSSLRARRQLMRSLQDYTPHDVRSLRRDPHARSAACWFHCRPVCLSRHAPGMPARPGEGSPAR